MGWEAFGRYGNISLFPEPSRVEMSDRALVPAGRHGLSCQFTIGDRTSEFQQSVFRRRERA